MGIQPLQSQTVSSPTKGLARAVVQPLDPIPYPIHWHSGADQPKITQTQINALNFTISNISALSPIVFNPTTGVISLGIGSSNQLLGVNAGGTGSEYKTIAVTSDLTIANSAALMTFGLSDTTVTPNTYGDSTHIPQVTVDQKGRITTITPISISFPGQTVDYTTPLLIGGM